MDELAEALAAALQESSVAVATVDSCRALFPAASMLR